MIAKDKGPWLLLGNFVLVYQVGSHLREDLSKVFFLLLERVGCFLAETGRVTSWSAWRLRRRLLLLWRLLGGFVL